MWLSKEIHTICIKEFGLRRHQLDIIQENAYIKFNLQKLTLIQFESDNSEELQWQHAFFCCNTLWFNIVGYLKFFPNLYSTLTQKNIFSFTPIVFRKDNFFVILNQRIVFCRQLLEVCRTVVYNGRLCHHIAKTCELKDLFLDLSEKCILTDPAGSRLIPLDNRVLFIRNWLEKLVLKHQASYNILPRRTLPIFPDTLTSSASIPSSFASANSNKFARIPVPIVSVTTPNLLFSRIKKRPTRLSEIHFEGGSDSCSSSSSIWAPPFKQSKYSIQNRKHQSTK